MTNPVTESIMINRSVSDLFSLWCDLESFPRFMRYIRSVSRTGDMTTHWVMSGPLDVNIEWDALVTNIIRNELIAWKTTGGDLETWGRVTFTAVAPTHTLVTAIVHYTVPYGKAGEWAARLFRDPGNLVKRELDNFKEFAESRVAVPAGG